MVSLRSRCFLVGATEATAQRHAALKQQHEPREVQNGVPSCL